MRPTSIVIAIVVAASLYLLVFERSALLALAQAPAETQAEAAEEPQREAVGVVAMKSTAREIDSAVLVRGRTEAARQVNVGAETTGQVVSEPLRRGAEVSEGDLLCRLDPGTRQATLAEARARLAEAEAQVAEAEINDNAAARLSQDGFASETRVASTQAARKSAAAAVEAARATIASAERELERLEIRAPFAGVMESDSAEKGALLQPGSLCATIIQLDPIKLTGYVPETEVDRVRIGAPAQARLSTGSEVEGEVTFISRSADPETRTFRVDAEVGNADRTIRDGQTVEMTIAGQGTTAHLLPSSALTLNDEGDLGVRIVDGDEAAFRSVLIVRDTADGVFVTGLEDTADVIVVGQEYVTEGSPVAVTYREGEG